jgi:DNA-directed RNA polymerase specialized sigma24 family protein
MLSRSQRKTIVDLQDYLTRIAHNLHNTHWTQVPADDILSEMNLFIAEKAQEDPTFLDQTPGYITRAAAWHARHWCRDTFTRYHNGERISRSVPIEVNEDKEEDRRPAYEAYAAPEVDSDIAIDVREALTGLDEVSLAVAELKMQGWRRKDIAAKLGYSSQALSTYLRRIEAALAPIAAAVGM